MNAVARVRFIRGAVMIHDVMMTALTWTLAFLLRYDFHPPSRVWSLLGWSIPATVAVFGLAFRWARLYSGLWRYASIRDLMRIGQAVGIGTLVVLALMFLTVRADDMPRSVLVIHPLLLAMALGGPRLLYRFWKQRGLHLPSHAAHGRSVLLVGAGDAAELLVRDATRYRAGFHVAGLLDDDRSKHGLRIHDVPVLGAIADLPQVVLELDAAGRRPDEVVIAIPSASRDDMRRIVSVCEQAGVRFRTAPSLADIVTGRVKIGELREVTIADILSRDTVQLDADAIGSLIGGQTVMVTGAGGSIGSELCRQIARFGPERIVLYEQCEFNLYQVDRELGRIFPDVPRVALLGDVRDRSRVDSAVRLFKPQVVLHAAAYKHVPLVEENATEGILNNILGTRTVAEVCVEHRVPRFVLVSTDKAVNPTNVMGATKRLAELYCQYLQPRGVTRFITVRFGNVLGSVGSVVPLFKEQIRAGGPVTVTHPDVQRYFMTIPEASQLILQAASLGRGGEIFVLDMGQSVRIVDLARDMIRLSGKEVGTDIDIVFTGLRPGEKLFEELLYDSEQLIDAGHDKIFLSRQPVAEIQWIQRRVDRLLEACRAQDTGHAVQVMMELVPEYEPADNGVAPKLQRASSA